MKTAHQALAAFANGEPFVPMRKVGQPLEPKTLGQIRRHCHNELKTLVVGELAKDFINSPIETIGLARAAA